jgi:hypothetical protein
MNSMMNSRRNVTAPDSAGLALYVINQKIEFCDGSEHYDFTHQKWTVDVYGEGIHLFTPVDCTDAQADFKQGHCCGMIRDVEKFKKQIKGKTTTNIAVSF